MAKVCLTVSERTELPVSPLAMGAAFVLRARGLRKAFGGQVVLDGVDLDLRGGEVVLLRGDNGSGKTTLVSILTGHLVPDAGIVELDTQGSRRMFLFPRPWWQRMLPFNGFCPEGMAQAGVSRSWQEVRLFGTQTLYDNVAVASPRQMGEGPFAALFRPLQVRREQRILREKVRETLAGLGLRERIDSSADRISLGQARRVSILRAVHGGARVLFLDEPLAGLDDVGRAAVLVLLRELAREHKLTLVIVEHVFNIPRVLDLADRVCTLASGRLTVEAPAAVREQVAAQTGDGLVTWLREIAGPGGRVTEEPLPGGAVLRRVAGAAGGDMVLHASDLVVHRGRRLVLGEELGDRVQGVSLTLRQGELVVLQAPNGWGKTTLLEALAGLLPLSRGTVRLLGRPVERLPAWERRRQGLTLLQARNKTFPNLTVREALRLAGVEEVPDGLARLLARPAVQLSGGEKQKVALACALRGTPFTVAILDEPFSALDLSALWETWAALAEWLPGRSMLIALPAVPGAEQGHPSMEA